jgi:hypothetical protein
LDIKKRFKEIVMRRFRYVVMLVALAVGLLSVSSASAQGVWNTGIDIQNLSGSAGTVVVQFYDDAGADVGSLTSTIVAWGSLNFYLPNQSAPPEGGQYSSVISSDVQVGATASQANYTLGGADIYLGTTSPENDLSFPLVYRNHTSGNWNTKLYVQNASAGPQLVTLRLFNAGATTAAATDSVTIPAYATHVFDVSSSTYAAFGPYGSATVEGAAPLAGVADAIRDPGVRVQVIETSYRAFGTAQQGRSAIAPLVYKNYNLWTTGVNVLNKGSIGTTVTITYTNANPNVSGGPWVDTLSLGAQSMGVFYTPSNSSLPDGFYGAAELSSSAADVVVVAASQRYRTDGAQGVAYEGSLPSDGTACVSLPVVHNRTTWKTGINIYNLGTSQANVTISYASSAPGISDASQTISIPADSPRTVYMPTDGTTTLGFYGAADIKSTNGQPLVVNAAHSRADQGVGSNFVGINYTCP